MAGAYIALNEAQDYIRFLSDQCRKLCSGEQNIETRYYSLGDSWVDPIYSKTGVELTKTAASVSKIYEIMTSTIDLFQEKVKVLCRYNGAPEPKKEYIEAFKVNIKEGKMNDSNSLRGTTSEALDKFERALKVYINDTDTIIRAIKSRHKSMHDTWRDKYYDQFTDVVNEFSAKINVQLETLTRLNIVIGKKRELLIQAGY